jgi:hypothetical protein
VGLSRIPYKLVLGLRTAAVLALPASLVARGHSSGSKSAHSSSHVSSGSHHSPGGHSARSRALASTGSHSLAIPGVARDSRGRIARSGSAKKEFHKSHPCPANGRTTGPCGGYVVDHVVPLRRGGTDSPSNMQWQTVQAAKIK